MQRSFFFSHLIAQPLSFKWQFYNNNLSLLNFLIGGGFKKDRSSIYVLNMNLICFDERNVIVPLFDVFVPDPLLRKDEVHDTDPAITGLR
ncbi:hypothetical protein R6Q59_010480 [Mikania micrantha]